MPILGSHMTHPTTHTHMAMGLAHGEVSCEKKNVHSCRGVCTVHRAVALEGVACGRKGTKRARVEGRGAAPT